MLTAVTSYDIGNFIHVAAVIVALGAPFGYAPFTALAESANPRAVPTVLRAMRRVDFTIVTPGMVLLLLAGIYMLADASISVGESWVSVGIAAIIARGAVGRVPRAVTPDQCRGGIAGIVVLVAAFFMVVKP